MIITASKVRDLLRQGDVPDSDDPFILCPEPSFDDTDLASAAVDLRLGTWFSVMRHGRTSHLAVGADAKDAKVTKTHYVAFGDTFMLHPQDFVLGVTLEWIRLPRKYAAYVIGKSSWGRRGLVIATATGVHPGFAGCLTLEMSNLGEVPIEIHPGMRICQLFVHSTEEGSGVTTYVSKFSGNRKPSLGSVRHDSLAEKLQKGSLIGEKRKKAP